MEAGVGIPGVGKDRPGGFDERVSVKLIFENLTFCYEQYDQVPSSVIGPSRLAVQLREAESKP